MKVYVIGSHSSGKSTLAKFISDRYNLPFLSEVARQILAEREVPLDNLRSNFDMINQYQKEIFFRQIKEEKREESFVSDRSLLDALAYTGQHTSLLNELLNSNECKDYIENIKKSDCVIFFVRPSKATMKADGIRETLVWEDMVAIDAMIKFVLEANSIKYISIHSSSMQERINLVSNVLAIKNMQ